MANTLLTKGQIRTAVLQAIDDPANNKWSATNLDLLITMVQDTMFQAILDTFPWFTSQADTIAPSGTGTIDTATGAAVLSQRFYRAQQVLKVAGSVIYQPRHYPESVPQASYCILGTQLQTTPAITGAASATVTYSFLPTRFVDLANDGTALGPGYPEGHENALIYLAASWAMTKGEVESMTQIARLADMALDSLLMHIARRSPTGGLSRVSQVKRSLVRNVLATQAIGTAPPAGGAP